jgi:uncharacterized protein
MQMLRIALLICLFAYGGAVVTMYLMQRSLLYYPENKGLTPEAVGLVGVQVVHLDTSDGEHILAWYAASKPGRPVIIHFHGNAGEIGDRSKRFEYIAGRGFGALFVSYRGFGGSSGEISEAGLITDAVTAYDWLIGQGVAPREIALLGESLGTGVAVQLAAQRPVGAVALEAPYTSTADIAAAIYWWLPVRLLMKDQFRSMDHIGAINAPLLVIHGAADTLIPVEYGKALFALANEPKELVIVPRAGHEVAFDESTWARELEFFGRHLMPKSAIQ